MYPTSISSRARAMATALVSVSAFTVSAAVAGDTDDASRVTRLSLLPAPLGGLSGIDLRTTTPNAPFVLFLGAAIAPANVDGAGPLPWLRVVGPGSLAVVLTTDATGAFRVIASPGIDTSLMGVTLFSQALSISAGGFDASNVAATTIAPGAPSWSYVDRSANVPAVAMNAASSHGAARDLDGDGDPDLVLATGATHSPHVFRNDGNFVFTDVTPSALPLSAQIDAALVELFDANGDGREDLLIIGGLGDPNLPPLPNLLLLNQGGMQFQTTSFPSVDGIARDVVATDLDRDGDLDLVLANGNDGVHAGETALPNALLVNQGFAQGGVEGAFVVDTAFQLANWNSASFNTCVCAGDIDNDGDDDLFFGRSDTQSADGTPGQQNVLLRNDGALSFSDYTPALQPLFSDNTADARFGDVDGDGWLDLLVANTTVGVKSANSGDYYRNIGGVFVEDNSSFPQIDESEIALRVALSVVDIDLDGDLDVLHGLHEFFDFNGSTGAQTGGDDLLFVNQGGAQSGSHGVFVLDPNFTKTGVFVTGDHIHADFDLDGDDDLYVTCVGGLFGPPVNDRLLENTRLP